MTSTARAPPSAPRRARPSTPPPPSSGPPPRARAAPRLALPPHRLVFKHPATGKTIDVESPFPRDLAPLLRRLGIPRPDAAAPGSVQGSHEVPGDSVSDEEPGIGED